MKITVTDNNRSRIHLYNGFASCAPQASGALSLRFVFDGNERYTLGKRSLAVHPSCFLLIRKGTWYDSSVTSEQAVNLLAIDINESFLNDFTLTTSSDHSRLLDNPFEPRCRQDEYMEGLYPFEGDIRYTAGHLAAHMRAGHLDDLLMNEYLHHCLMNYRTLLEKQVAGAGQRLQGVSPVTRREIMRRLNMARECIYSNYNQPLSLADIAGYACMSPNHLLRTFRQAFDTSPHQFLVRLRLERARQLLKASDYPVSEIVGIVGFENPSSFIRLFRETYRLTPLKYRQSA